MQEAEHSPLSFRESAGRWLDPILPPTEHGSPYPVTIYSPTLALEGIAALQVENGDKYHSFDIDEISKVLVDHSQQSLTIINNGPKSESVTFWFKTTIANWLYIEDLEPTGIFPEIEYNNNYKGNIWDLTSPKLPRKELSA